MPFVCHCKIALEIESQSTTDPAYNLMSNALVCAILKTPELILETKRF